MSEVHTLTLLFRGTESAWKLTFHSKAAAEAAYAKSRSMPIDGADTEVSDDYGLSVSFNPAEVIARQLCDGGRMLEGQKESQMMTLRAQVKLRQQVMSDPQLKLLAHMLAPPAPGTGFPQ